MLANDSIAADKKSAFFLVVHRRPLMAECPKCSAIASYGLELTWGLRFSFIC
jgi:hypothetical protein